MEGMEQRKDDTLKVVRNNRSRDRPSSPSLHLRYQKMIEAIRDNPTEITKFQQVIQEATQEYAVDKGELTVINGGRNVYFSQCGKPFTNFGAIPLKVLRINSVENTLYEIEILIMGKDLPTQKIKVDASKLASSRWIESLGVAYLFERNKLWNLKTLIQIMAKYAPLEEYYQYSGWKLDSGNVYIVDGHPLCDKGCWKKDTERESCEHALKMLDVAPPSVTIPLIAIEILSLVHSWMIEGDVYFKGVCCLVAPTQSFKTTLASLFFDYDHGVEADINFEATTAALVRTVGSVRDSVVIVDDYKPGATRAENNDMIQKLSKIVRMCSDDSGGIKKAGIDNSTVTNIAHGIAVVTAEQIQLNVQSTQARLLVLELDKRSIDVEKLTWLQAHHDRYRAFVNDYILYIGKQGVACYCKRLVQKFLQARNTLREKLNAKDVWVDNRSSDMCTWIYISFSEFLDWALSIKGIDEEKFDSLSAESKEIFLNLLEQQAERVSELDETKRFFKALQVLLETKEVHIEKLQARNNSYATPNSQTAIGFTKQGYVYLKNNTAFQQVAAYYRRNGREFAASESAIRKKLADNGCILPSGAKSFIHRLYVNHETYQCIKFNDAKFEEVISGGKNDGTVGNREIPDNRSLYRNAENFLGGGI